MLKLAATPSVSRKELGVPYTSAKSVSFSRLVSTRLASSGWEPKDAAISGADKGLVLPPSAMVFSMTAKSKTLNLEKAGRMDPGNCKRTAREVDPGGIGCKTSSLLARILPSFSSPMDLIHEAKSDSVLVSRFEIVIVLINFSAISGDFYTSKVRQ